MNLEQRIIDDTIWEARMKQLGIKGWQLTKLFLERVYAQEHQVIQGQEESLEVPQSPKEE